jgi:hypothetical protein
VCVDARDGLAGRLLVNGSERDVLLVIGWMYSPGPIDGIQLTPKRCAIGCCPIRRSRQRIASSRQVPKEAMGVRTQWRLGLAAVVGCLLVSSFASPASAEAACTVSPNYPILQHHTGPYWSVRAYAYISGCTGRGNYVDLFLAEEIQRGNWHYVAGMHLARPETANHPGWPVGVNCRTMTGPGRFATAWRINGGPLRRSGLVHKLC